MAFTNMAFLVLTAAVTASVSGQSFLDGGCGCQPPYPICTGNCGPQPCPLPPIALREIVPTVVKPTINLPAPYIPPPTVISNFCNCQKKIVKPQVYQKTITVPSVQNVVSTNYKPITETICYQGCPQCGCGYPAPSPCSCGCQIPPPCSCGCQIPPPCDCGCPIPSPCGCGSPIPPPCGCGSPFPPPCDCGCPIPPPCDCGCPIPPPCDCGCPIPPPCSCGYPPSNYPMSSAFFPTSFPQAPFRGF